MLARALAMATYRSAREFEERFPGEAELRRRQVRLPGRGLPALARRGLRRALPARSVRVPVRVDRPASHRARTHHVPTTLVAVHEDQLVPIADMRTLRDRLAGTCQLVEINSLYGHDAFLKETAVLRDVFCAVTRADTMTHKDSITTRTVRAALETDTQHGAVVPPIHLTSTFAFGGLRREARVRLLALRQPDARCAGSRAGRTRRRRRRRRHRVGHGRGFAGHAAGGARAARRRAARLLRRHLPPVQRAARARLAAGAVRRLPATGGARPRRSAARPALVWIETPSNPLLRIVDIRDGCARAQAAGALVVADNTFLSPVWQQPLALGADLVVHSTTKYLNGHSDVVGGAVIAATPELHEQVEWWGNCIGVTGAPFDSFLTLRGLRTLHARMRAHGENAQRIAELLAQPPGGGAGLLSGPASHPGHAIARTQQQGFGAMVSFELHGSRGERQGAASTTRTCSRSPSRSAASRAWSRIRRA